MNGQRFTWIGLLALSLVLALPLAAQNDPGGLCFADIDHRSFAADRLEAGDYTEAYDAYTCVVQASPDDWTARLARARAGLLAAAYDDNFDVDLTTDLPLVAANAPDVFQAAFDEATARIDADPAAVDALLWRGYASYYQNNLDAALSDVDQALAVAPDMALLHLLRGMFQNFIGGEAEATAAFTRALELAPASAGLPSLIGLAYLRTSNVEQAVAYYSLAVERDPANPQYLAFRGYSSMQLSDIDAALADFDAAIAIDSNNPDYYVDRASAHQWVGNWDRVIEDMTRAIALDDHYQYAWQARAAAYVFTGRYEEALSDYDAAFALNPDDPLTLLGRGTTQLALGNAAAGAADYLAYVRLIEQATSEVATGALQPGASLSLDMHQGWVYSVPFEAEANDRLDLAARAPNYDVDTLIVLLDPEGRPVTGSDDSDDGLGSAIADFAAPRKGTYTLVVTHAGGGSEGAVEVTLDVTPALTPATGGTSRGG